MGYSFEQAARCVPCRKKNTKQKPNANHYLYGIELKLDLTYQTDVEIHVGLSDKRKSSRKADIRDFALADYSDFAKLSSRFERQPYSQKDNFFNSVYSIKKAEHVIQFDFKAPAPFANGGGENILNHKLPMFYMRGMVLHGAEASLAGDIDDEEIGPIEAFDSIDLQEYLCTLADTLSFSIHEDLVAAIEELQESGKDSIPPVVKFENYSIYRLILEFEKFSGLKVEIDPQERELRLSS